MGHSFSVSWVVVFVLAICGRFSCEHTRIVGGQNAPPNTYPYQISLQIVRTVSIPVFGIPIPTPFRGWAHNCGGSIVTQRHVVTAAHCLKPYNATDLSILAGTTLLNGGNGTRVLVESFLIHPNYVMLNTTDIGIITTAEPFVFSNSIAPITYSTEEIGANVTCVLTGWGYTTLIRIGEPPNDLQRINLTTISNEECTRRIGVDDTGICTNGDLGMGACGGDSGGPLALGNLLVGVVSYGTSVCAVGVPDVFTRVSVFYDWIRSNTA